MSETTIETQDQRVTFSMRGDIAVLEINNPPVNAGSHAVRIGVVDGLAKAVQAGATGVVLTGAGRCFVAGSDLREFGKPLAPPELPDVIRTIEKAPISVVAAMHGVALGGGLELSLGCDYRVAAPGTKLGLPEVSLGFVPGAGGTQRVPRLVGQSRAIEMICAASRLPASAALDVGLIDAVVEGDLVQGAIDFLNQEAREKRLAIQLTPPAEDTDAVEAAATKALKRGKGRPNVSEAIRLVRSAADTDGAAALADERAVFQEMRLSDDAFALRYLFFSERRAGSVDGLDGAAARDIARVGVLGGGTMGQGIAKAFLASGLPVVLIERDEAALAGALAKIQASFDGLVAKGRMAEAKAKAQMALISGAVDYAALADCDLVIEAVFEDMDVKKDVLARLEAALPETAILATNTSYLNIDEMVSAMDHPERVVGLHFFSPADRMPLLEVVRADKTSDAVLASSLKLARKLNKQPVVARVGEGFIGNRIYAAYRGYAEVLVLDGATPQQVDAAVTGLGFAMGPFAVSDLSGLDIAWAMRKRKAATRDPLARYVTLPDTLCEMGRLGRKTGKGWYAYPEGKPVADPEVDALISAARDAAGVTPRDFDTQTLQMQLMAAIVNEAACVLDEGIAQRPSDVDVVLANGYGFPRWRGGPLYWAAKQDRAQLSAALDTLAKGVGHGFKAGPVFEILDQIQADQKG